MKKFLVISIIILNSLNLSAQNANELFKQANRLYNDGNYVEAIQVYESILEKDLHSSELYFNLANAYYKSNQVAPSIYYYEKALQLEPDDKDVKNNLVFAQNMTLDSIETIPEVGVSKVVKNAIATLNYDGWAYISVGCMIFFVLMILLYYFSFSTANKRMYFVSSFISLFICIMALTFAFQSYDWAKKDNPAIVFAEEAEVKTDPNLRSETAFKLHEGAKIQIIEIFDENWVKLKLADGKIGWIAAEDIKLLNKF